MLDDPVLLLVEFQISYKLILQLLDDMITL